MVSCVLKNIPYMMTAKCLFMYSNYCIVGKFGKFEESSMIRQSKTIQISTYN